MNSSASFDFRTSHPLAGLESWPKTGPVYGFAEEEPYVPARTLWQRIGDRMGRAPEIEPTPKSHARVWY